MHEYLLDYQAVMLALTRMVSGDRAAHISAGLLVWVMSALVLRLPLRDIRPLVVVFVVEALNELIDRLTWGSWRWRDTRGDLISTYAWPTILFITMKLKWPIWR